MILFLPLIFDLCSYVLKDLMVVSSQALVGTCRLLMLLPVSRAPGITSK